MGLRLKRSWAGVEIHGPRQLVTGDRVRVSGVSRGAARLPDGSFVGRVWQSLAAAVADRSPTTVEITNRRWHLRGVDRRRVECGDGWTYPVRVGGIPTGVGGVGAPGGGGGGGGRVAGRGRPGVAGGVGDELAVG